MKIRKAVIPAAGVGTRFLPATKVVPKELLPVVDRPLIHEVVVEAVQSDICNLVLVTAAGKSAIEDYFDINPALERFLAEKGKEGILKEIRRISRMVDISAVRQKEPRGLGHAILCARDFVGVEPFAVMLPDELMDGQVPCLKQLSDHYMKTGRSVIALKEVPESQTHRYGIIEGELTGERSYRIRGVVEKPGSGTAPSNMAVIGRYILDPKIFTHIESLDPGAGGEIQLTDGLEKLAHEGELDGLVFKGVRHDAGDKLGFLMATVHYALKDTKLGPPFLEYLKEIVRTSAVK